MQFTQDQLENLIQYIPEKLIETFGGIDKILTLPKYQLDNSEFGQLRNYPDFIKYNDVEQPIMIGVDKYRRIFIVFKFQYVLSDETRYITEVLFQRYTDSKIWTSASNPCGVYTIMANGTTLNYDVIEQVLTNERVKNVHNRYHDIIGDYVLG